MIDIQIPYTTNPSMRKNKDSIFNSSPDQSIIEEKKQQLEIFGEDLWASLDIPITQQLINTAANFCNQPNIRSIVELALTLEEDIAILHNSQLVSICFCFPSSWIPREKIGLELREIHKPVADADKLISMSQKISLAASNTDQGSFRRSVWTITNNPDLSNHPKNKKHNVPYEITDLYFRTEIQTTCPLGDNLSHLFFVKVNVVPLIDVWNIKGEQIVASLNSMSQNILEYKNLIHIKQLINKFDKDGLISHK